MTGEECGELVTGRADWCPIGLCDAELLGGDFVGKAGNHREDFFYRIYQCGDDKYTGMACMHGVKEGK